MISTAHGAKGKPTHPTFELLETRELLSGYQPTAVEQLFLEQLNDARANPAAYGASIGVDLSNVAPSQPLAFDPQLIQAARMHSQDMSNRGYFSHNTPEGVDPGRRMSDAGFAWRSWGESLAAGSAFQGPPEALRALIIDSGIPDLGHRHHLLAMSSLFQRQNQVGIGLVQGTSGPLTNYYTIDSAGSSNPQTFLTGVVFVDSNGNGKYDIGEGLAGVTITVAGVGSTTTYDSGGYSIPVNPGTYTVTATGGGLGAPIVRTVTVSSSNYRLNLSPSALDSNSVTYVRNLYQTILGRPGTEGEVALWAPVLQGSAGTAGVASAIEQSAEARTRLVNSWYTVYLGRRAQNGEEQVWVNALLKGAKEEDIQAAILGSDEFFAHAGWNNESYINALYAALLNRAGTMPEVNGWLATLPAVGRTQVASRFVHSTEYLSGMVASYYSSLLHRSQAPASQEIAAWVGTGLDCLAMRIRFETSNEFLQSG
jgi:uncharacterized protein YkwD